MEITTKDGRKIEATTIGNTGFERIFLHPGSAEIMDILVSCPELDYSVSKIQELTGLSIGVVMSNLQNLKQEKIIIENNNGKLQLNENSDRAVCLHDYYAAVIQENLDGMMQNSKM